MAFLAAIVSAVATISAAYMTFIASERRRAAIEALARSDDKRQLTLEELEYIQLAPSATDQLTGKTTSQSVDGPAKIRLVYPGSSRFRSYNESKESSTYDKTEDVSYSQISVLLDGAEVGVGDGVKGFAIPFESPIGRHNLVLMWTGSRKYSTYANTESGRDRYGTQDLAGRAEQIIWVIRSASCTVHLDHQMEIDHVEPEVVLKCCSMCKMPGIRRCKCGRRYCLEHLGIVEDKEVCLTCKEEDVQRKLQIGRKLAIGVAIAAGIAALYSLIT